MLKGAGYSPINTTAPFKSSSLFRLERYPLGISKALLLLKARFSSKEPLLPLEGPLVPRAGTGPSETSSRSAPEEIASCFPSGAPAIHPARNRARGCKTEIGYGVYEGCRLTHVFAANARDLDTFLPLSETSDPSAPNPFGPRFAG
jgi:hypothetical protein